MRPAGCCGDRLDDHTEDAIAVIEAVATGPVVFVGLSIGGLIARRVAELRPDLVRATAGLIRGAAFHVIPGAGHLPCVEAPDARANLVGPFLKAHAQL